MGQALFLFSVISKPKLHNTETIAMIVLSALLCPESPIFISFFISQPAKQWL